MAAVSLAGTTGGTVAGLDPQHISLIDDEPVADAEADPLRAPRFSLINDEPVADPESDLLGASGPAEQLAALLVASRRSTPFTLSVDSGWGTGKSTLMRLVEKELREKHGARTVWYNAWSSTGAEPALEGLIKSVLGEFDKSVLRRTVYKVSKHSTTLKLIRASLRLLAGAFGLGHVVNELWRGLRVSPQARNEMRDAIREVVRERVENGEFSPRDLLIVFIDDLDRCTEETVLAVCEAVKIYLDIPGLAFVIGCDRSALTSNGLLRDLSPAGSAFMEKIFQTTYRLPVPDGSGIESFVERCAGQSRIDTLLNPGIVSRIAELCQRNPRRIKKLINGFVLEVGLNPLWRDFLPRAVESVVSTLVLQYLYPGFHRMLVGRGSSDGDVLAEFQTYRRVRLKLRLKRRQGEVESGSPEDGESGDAVADDAEMVSFFNEHVVPQPSLGDTRNWDQDLQRLEAELPREFPDLAADRAFVSLVDHLEGQPRYQELIRRLRQRPPSEGVFASQIEDLQQPQGYDELASPGQPAPVAYGPPGQYAPPPWPPGQYPAPPQGPAGESGPSGYGPSQYGPPQYGPPPYGPPHSGESPWLPYQSEASQAPSAPAGAAPAPAPRAEQPLGGMRILWIDDNPSSVELDVRAMRRAGAHVEVVADRAEAERRLNAGDQDLLISDITRGSDSQAGFTDVQGMRNGGFYDGPVIFFTGRVTPAREAWAEELGALGVTASPDELRELVVQAARGRGSSAASSRGGPEA